MSESVKKILSFYDSHIEEHGSGPRAVGWNDRQSQAVRFAALCKVGELESSSVLDVGCGVGDFWSYIEGHYGAVEYTGIDINPQYVERARQMHPNIHFEVANFSEYTGGPFDHVCASGLFAVKIPNYKEVYFGQIKKMFELARRGVAFNMLDVQHHPNDETYAAYSTEEVREFCRSLTDDITIYHDYLPHDFTIVLRKTASDSRKGGERA